MEELLPDRLKALWRQVDEGLLSAEEFHETQIRLLGEYRREWEQALMHNGCDSLMTSILSEIGEYLGNGDLAAIREMCCQALTDIKGEWLDKVRRSDRESVEEFYDSSRAMLFELMWWHTLVDDLSPLAYVVCLKFAQRHGCRSYLDFGCGVGSGGLLFASHGFDVSLADISTPSLDFCKWRFDRANHHAHLIDLKQQSLPEAAFDFITAMDVFEHLVDPVSTVHQIDRALKPGGYLAGRFHAEADADRPHHIVLDFKPTIRELESLGFVKVWQDEWLWGHEIYQKAKV